MNSSNVKKFIFTTAYPDDDYGHGPARPQVPTSCSNCRHRRSSEDWGTDSYAQFPQNEDRCGPA